MTSHPVYNSSFDLGLYITYYFYVYFEYVQFQSSVRVNSLMPCLSATDKITMALWTKWLIWRPPVPSMCVHFRLQPLLSRTNVYVAIFMASGLLKTKKFSTLVFSLCLIPSGWSFPLLCPKPLVHSINYLSMVNPIYDVKKHEN